MFITMKLQVLQENLSRALSITSRFANTRAQLPVLANILLSTKKNKLLVSSTNLEISVSISVGAKIGKEGEITVPARTITDLISNLPPGAINVQTEKEQIKISAQNFNSVLSGMNSSDFPSIPQTVGKGALKLPKDDILDALSCVLFAASIDETRPVLTGVLLIFKRDNLFLVATDGFRLSQKKLPLKAPRELQRIILPKSALSELSRLADDGEKISFSYAAGDSQVIFGIGDAVLTSRVIEGEFPDFEKIIPKESNFKVNVDKEELFRAVRLASVFARDSANVVKIAVKKGSIELSAESQQAGSQETSVDAKVEGKVSGKDGGLEISFNYRFLEDFLNVAKGEDVQIEFSSSSAPGVFTDPKDSNFLHLIMPVRTQA